MDLQVPPKSPCQRESTTLDQAFDTLSHRHRREILTTLCDTDSQQHVAFAPEDVVEDDHDAVRTALYHVHLPYLDDRGLIEWNEETDTIYHGSAFDEIEPLVELLRDNQDALPADWP